MSRNGIRLPFAGTAALFASLLLLLLPALLFFLPLFLFLFLFVGLLVAAEYLGPEAALLLRFLGCVLLGCLLAVLVTDRRVAARARRRRRRENRRVGRDRNPGVFSKATGESIQDRRRLVDRADGRRLCSAREILRVHHRPRLELAVLRNDLRRLAACGGQLAREATDVDPDDVLGFVEPLSLGAFRRPLHEAGPDRHGDIGGVAVGDDRPGLVEADPDAGDEMRREAYEPRVVVVVGRAGLPGGGKRETHLPRAVGRSRRDHVREHARHQIGRRRADSLVGLAGRLIQDLPVGILNAPDHHRVAYHAAVGERTVCGSELRERHFARAERQ